MCINGGMPTFALQLKPALNDEWSYIVRNHIGAIVAERRCLPNRLTAEHVGQAEIRRLSKSRGGFKALAGGKTSAR